MEDYFSFFKEILLASCGVIFPLVWAEEFHLQDATEVNRGKSLKSEKSSTHGVRLQGMQTIPSQETFPLKIAP